MNFIPHYRKLDELLRFLNGSYELHAGRDFASPQSAEVWKSREEILDHFKQKAKGHEVSLKQESFWLNQMAIETLSGIDLMLEYLQEEGYVKQDQGKYVIRWKGRVFIEQGGFESLHNATISKQRQQKLLYVYLPVLSLWTSVALLIVTGVQAAESMFDILRNHYNGCFRAYVHVFPYAIVFVSTLLISSLFLQLRILKGRGKEA